MLYMRRAVVFACLMAVAVFLAGCMEVISHVVINKDGSVDVESSLAVDKDLLAMAQAGDPKDPFEELRQQLRRDGFEVLDYDEGDLTGIKARKHFADPTEVDKVFPASSEKASDVPQSANFSVQKGFFRTTYNFAGDIDLTMPNVEQEAQAEDEFAKLGSALSRAFLSQLNMRFLVTLPAKPEYHNATRVSNGGRTLEWELRPGKRYHLEFRASVLNVPNLLVVLGGASAAVLAMVLFLRLKKPKSAQVEAGGVT